MQNEIETTPKKKKRVKPTDYRQDYETPRWFGEQDVEEVKKKLKDAFSVGCGRKQAIAHARISKSSFDRYLKANPEFKEELLMLRHMPNIQAKFSVYKAIPKDPALAFKFLQVKERSEYGNHIGITTVDATESMSDEEISEIKKIFKQENIDFEESEFLDMAEEQDPEDEL